MRKLLSIVAEISRQGRYLDRTLRVEKLNKMAWVEFRHMVKVMNRLMVNLTDFNAVHFALLGSRERRMMRKATAQTRANSGPPRTWPSGCS